MSHVPRGSTGEQPANAPRTDGAGRGSRSRSLDAIFDLLANQRRREALYVLCRREDPVPVTELAEEVASVVTADPERVAVSLRHVHLPKLADEGIVDRDDGAETVGLADDAERLYPYLHVAATDEGRFIGIADGVPGGDERDVPQSES